MLEIKISEEKEICVVHLYGDVVFSEVLELENTMKQLFTRLVGNADGSPPPVIINFESVEIMDSSGVATLVGLHLESKHRLIVLGFVNFHRRVLDVIERTHVDVLLSIFNTEEEGRQHLTDLERTHERFHCSFEASLMLNDGSEYPIQCFNVSQGGIGAFSKKLIPIDEDIFRFKPLHSGFTALVYVSRIAIQPQGYEVGLEFHKKDAKHLNTIQELAKSLSHFEGAN